MVRLTVLAAAVAAAVAADANYWWVYPKMDAENEDIKQMKGATIAELEAACLATSGCVAFNSNGWLKNSVADMAADSCDLYVLHTTPQPSPTPTPLPPAISLWPQPRQMTNGTTTIQVSSTAFNWVATTPSTDLTNAFSRFNALLFPNAVPGAAPVKRAAAVGAEAYPLLTTLTVTVANVNVPLQLGVDETYVLTIPADGTGATLTAATVYGAYQGLQTFSQLVKFDYDQKLYRVDKAPLVITDGPDFAWRGVLIDTDRHFQPLSSIFGIIDSITYAKMNVIHWHIVDWQSWPMESAAYPNLWTAAWSPRERYTFEDVAAVVEYARQRGVRVVPEFDTPGHAGSICVGYPEVCPSPTCTMPLSPITNKTFDLINAVLTEISALTPDNFFHLGGDEVDTSCWTNTPAVAAWMAAHNYTADQTYEYMVQIVDAQTIALGRIPMRWEEVWKHFRTELDPRTIIHVWLSAATMADVVNNGYRGVWSVDGTYYLDALDESWTKFYDADILAGITNVTAQPLVMGGEVEMWGETADASDVQQTIWPRAAAAAERWWNYKGTTNSQRPDVAARLADFRCLLLARGVAAAPLNNAVARAGPPGPGSCVSQ